MILYAKITFRAVFEEARPPTGALRIFPERTLVMVDTGRPLPSASAARGPAYAVRPIREPGWETTTHLPQVGDKNAWLRILSALEILAHADELIE